jgi:fumarate hydratase class II
LVDRCINGIIANKERAESLIENSLAMVTALAPKIGYDAAAKLANEAYGTGKTVRQIAREQNILSEDELNRVLDPMRLTEAGLGDQVNE